MLIGIDASRALSPTPTGTENYSREVIRALLNQPSTHHFRLYTRAIPSTELLPVTKNFDVRTIPFARLWTHARLSLEMLQQPPDLLFVPAHVLPLVQPQLSLVTIHDLGYLHFPETHPVLQRLYLDLSTRWSTRTATRVIAVSNVTADDLYKSYHVPRGKIVVVYPSYSPHFCQTVSPVAIAEARARHGLGEKYVLAVGTLHPRKNYERLIRAFVTFARDYELVIVGRKGWRYREIFQAVREVRLEARVRFLEYVPGDDLPPLYQGAAAFVFPSLYEGFGIPILEAQASGIPVACSNTSSLPEVAGEAAEFFEPEDTAAITRAVERVLYGEAHRAELIQRGRKNITRFSWADTARKILEIINTV